MAGLQLNPSPSPPIGRAQYLGYTAGEIANNLTFSMVSAFLLIYYTDVAGISATTAGTLFLVARVWGGATDLLAGRVVDHTSTRWGRFRPFLLFGSVPLLALLIAVFSIPGGLSDGGKLAWGLVSYLLFQLAYSFVNIPYGSLSAAMTQRPDERARFSAGRVIAASATILLIAVVVSPQISGTEDLQRSLTITTMVFAVLGLALYLWCFFTARESVMREQKKTGIRETVAMLRGNRPLVILCASTLLFLTGMFSLQTVGVYYARDVLGNADLYITMTVMQTIGMVAVAGIVPRLVVRWGKRRAYLAAGIVSVVAGVGIAIAPSSVPVLGMVCFALFGLGLGAINTLIFALQADTVDYGEYKSGIRAEGASYSALSFTRKAGQGVGGALAAYTIALGGYTSGASSQTGEALISIRIAAGGLPAIVILLAALVMLAYPLSESSLRKIVQEMAQRRAGGAVPDVT